MARSDSADGRIAAIARRDFLDAVKTPAELYAQLDPDGLWIDNLALQLDLYQRYLAARDRLDAAHARLNGEDY